MYQKSAFLIFTGDNKVLLNEGIEFSGWIIEPGYVNRCNHFSYSDRIWIFHLENMHVF